MTMNASSVLESTDSAAEVTKPRRRLKRILGGVAATAAASALALGAAASPAAASTYYPTNAYISPASSATLMLDVQGASQAAGAQVVQWYLNGGANQKWNFQQLSDGNKQIINVNSGQCLTTDGVAGDGVYQYPCLGYTSQEWNTDFAIYSGGYFIQSASSGLYLDVYGDSPNAGAIVDTWYYNAGANQQFGGFQG
jgi:hypothetical protein